MNLQRLKLIGGFLSVIGGSLVTYEYGDEVLLAGGREQQLEERPGKEVFLGWTDWSAEREGKVGRLEETIIRTRAYWNNFEQQFSLVPYINVNRKDSIRDAGADYLTGAITVTCTGKGGKSYCTEDDTLVHELAHVWQDALPNREVFEEKWKKISGGEYIGKSNYKINKFDYKGQARKAEELATTSFYGTIALNEDVAETVRFVYLLAAPHWIVIPFEDFTKDSPSLAKGIHNFVITRQTIPRVMKKIRLLREYGFISWQEENKACRIIFKQEEDSCRKEP